MRIPFFILTFISVSFFSFGQTTLELFEAEEYEKITIKYPKSTDLPEDISLEDLEAIGHSHLFMDNFGTAIDFYTVYIEKDPKLVDGYFWRANGNQAIDNNKSAIEDYNTILELEPDHTSAYVELGLLYYYNDQYDKALELFEKGKEVSKENKIPFYLSAHVKYMQGNNETALEELYASKDLMGPEETYWLGGVSAYSRNLMDIAAIEEGLKNFDAAQKAYDEYFEINPEDYELMESYIQMLNRAEKYEAGAKQFKVMQTAFHAEKLPKDYYEEPQSLLVDKLEFNGRICLIYRAFKDPEEFADPYFIFYQLDTEARKIDRLILSEKTMPFGEDSPKHLLCEIKESSRGNFGIGWKTDDINLGDFKKTVLGILKEERGLAIEMVPGKGSSEKASKKKKKKKKKNKKKD